MASDTKYLVRTHDGNRIMEFRSAEEARDFLRGKPYMRFDLYRRENTRAFVAGSNTTDSEGSKS